MAISSVLMSLLTGWNTEVVSGYIFLYNNVEGVRDKAKMKLLEKKVEIHDKQPLVEICSKKLDISSNLLGVNTKTTKIIMNKQLFSY